MQIAGDWLACYNWPHPTPSSKGSHHGSSSGALLDHIPAQVRARVGREACFRSAANLSGGLIDNAAMAAGIIDSDAYTDGFHWKTPASGPAQSPRLPWQLLPNWDAAYPLIDWRNTADQLKSR